ncbi:MAG: hypothetical protein R3293_18415, partial [Candidatus Promineifilaceae bacterium]|nr:hypothetical protein [Candidatus Promineifilaceae bacterium]
MAIYTVGGPPGKMLRNLVNKDNLAQKAIPIAGLTRESFAVRETETNLQYRFSVPGPLLSESERRACMTAVRELQPRPEYLELSGGLLPGVPHDF